MNELTHGRPGRPMVLQRIGLISEQAKWRRMKCYYFRPRGVAAKEPEGHTAVMAFREETRGMDALPFGIDFGGSGIKGAPVDLGAGDFAADRVKIKTPQPSTPEAVANVLVGLLGHFPDSTGSVGVTVPAVVRHGVVNSAANIDRAWVGTDADALFTAATGREVHVVNDADAAGLAEVRYGAAAGRRGLVIVTTLGTGIGSAIVYDGVLMPNSELGHLEIDCHDAESRAAHSAKEKEGLSYAEWAKRLTLYYRTVERLFSPDLIVVGGGVSKDAAEFLHLIDIKTEIVPAKLQNRAGIVGAALWAAESVEEAVPGFASRPRRAP